MPFIKRLGFFLVGLSIGLIFLAIFLKKKSAETGTEFCYLPNCRVLKELRNKPLQYSGRVEAMLMDQVVDSTDIAYLLKEGDVDFGASDTEAEPCTIYKIEGQPREKQLLLTAQNCDSLVRIEAINLVE